MNARDTAKEIVRITSRAGPSKDVIDLLEKKLAILTGELSDAQRKIAGLETENNKLRTQLHNIQPVEFQESMGVLWKRTPKGYEPHPYCKECQNHPVMMPIKHAGIWLCANGDHHALLSAKPPSA